MAIQIGARPDSGFDDPIGMLTDCHRRIERFIHVLCRVAEHAGDRTLTSGESEAVDAALRYFHESGPRHNSDEEDSLFPRLRKTPAAQVVNEQVLNDVDRLEGEHHQTEAMHKEAAELFTRWQTEEMLHADDRARLRAVTSKLEEIYREHIRLEEEVVFPCAARVLDPGTIAAIAGEFKARRA